MSSPEPFSGVVESGRIPVDLQHQLTVRSLQGGCLNIYRSPRATQSIRRRIASRARGGLYYRGSVPPSTCSAPASIHSRFDVKGIFTEKNDIALYASGPQLLGQEVRVPLRVLTWWVHAATNFN